jgi:hypothetical protein
MVRQRKQASEKTMVQTDVNRILVQKTLEFKKIDPLRISQFTACITKKSTPGYHTLARLQAGLCDGQGQAATDGLFSGGHVLHLGKFGFCAEPPPGRS